MELKDISQEILKLNKELISCRNELRQRALTKSGYIAEYDKTLAIVTLKLKNGGITEFEGERIDNPPTTLIDKISKGICWREKLEADKAESLYKNAIKGMEATKAAINSLQSLYKYQTEV